MAAGAADAADRGGREHRCVQHPLAVMGGARHGGIADHLLLAAFDIKAADLLGCVNWQSIEHPASETLPRKLCRLGRT